MGDKNYMDTCNCYVYGTVDVNLKDQNNDILFLIGKQIGKRFVNAIYGKGNKNNQGVSI